MNLEQLMEQLTVIIANPVKTMVVKISGYVPALVGALVILILGWIIAKFIEATLVRVLRAARVDVASDKTGMTKMLQQGDIKLSLSEVIGVISYWLVVLIALVAALNALNLTIAADLLSRLVGYVPNIIAAIFVLVLGMFLANFVSIIVRTSASNAGIGIAKLLGRITRVVLIVFAIAVAIEQLKVGTALIGFAVNVILASVGLGCAIAFGLGCKDVAGKAVSDLVNNMKK
ncbi:hypothetical protein ACFL42_04355 [Candidatus Omnitrophota bacterium]